MAAIMAVPWVVGAATSGFLHLAGRKKLNVRRPLPPLTRGGLPAPLAYIPLPCKLSIPFLPHPQRAPRRHTAFPFRNRCLPPSRARNAIVFACAIPVRPSVRCAARTHRIASNPPRTCMMSDKMIPPYTHGGWGGLPTPPSRVDSASAAFNPPQRVLETASPFPGESPAELSSQCSAVPGSAHPVWAHGAMAVCARRDVGGEAPGVGALRSFLVQRPPIACIGPGHTAIRASTRLVGHAQRIHTLPHRPSSFSPPCVSFTLAPPPAHRNGC